MQGYPGGKAADHYLVQRIQGASPEQVAALLLEGGQRFLNLMIKAIQNQDLPNQAIYIGRISDILLGLKERLNLEDGGEVVENLIRLYDWWANELYEGSLGGEPERLRVLFNQMGELKETWEELHRRKSAGSQPAGSTDGFSV
jgi:flagellar protein FliS